MYTHLQLSFCIYILFITICNSDTYVSADSDCGSSCDGSQALPYLTIRQGLNDPTSNTLIILSGTYTGYGNTNITIDQSYTIITTDYPNDPSHTIIDCEKNSWGIVLLSDSYHITGLTVRNCVAPLRQSLTQQHQSQTLGGALFMQNLGIGTINNCMFENNIADIGGAIYIHAAAVHLANTIVQNNRAENSSGGVHVQNADLRLLDETLIENNYAKENGGGIYSKSAGIELYNKSQIKSNSADNKGNNIYCDNGHVNLYDDSDIDGSNNANYIVCVACDIKEFNDKHELKKNLCPSDHPNNHSKTEGQKIAPYLITVLIIFIIGCIIACCYFYKKRQKHDSKYEGLLEN
eukprot:327138_1